MSKRDRTKRMAGFISARQGTTAIEYALIAALLAVAGITGVHMLGSKVNSEYTYINNAIS
jgi:Flp pilus assembly pilin Flp